MASNRRVEVKRIATNKPGTFLEVSIGYRDGKSEFSSGARGYYVNVGYVETRDGMEFHVLGRGGAGLLEAALRFSQKRMNVFVEQANDPFNEPLNLIVARVLERNGLTLPVEDEVCV
jgi:hypothetical protein